MNSLTDERETPAKPRLLTQVRERIRFHHFALSTEKVTFIGFGFSFGFMGCGIPKRWGGLRLRHS